MRISQGFFKAGLGRRHYFVRLIAAGRTPRSEVAPQLEAASSLLGKMFTQTRQGQTTLVREVRLAQEPSGDVPIALSLEGSYSGGTFDFTVVNGNVTHCVWIASPGPGDVSV